MLVASAAAAAGAEPPDPWRVMRGEVESIEVPAAIAAHPVLRELEIDSGSTRVEGSRHDLDGDGAAEYVVQSGPTLCGNGGCPYAIFDGQRHVYLGQVFGNLVRRAPGRFNGWAILECFSHLGTVSTAYTAFAFSGREYERVVSLQLPDGLARRLRSHDPAAGP